MSPTALILFIVFAIVQLGMYVAVRRALFSPTVIGVVGVLAGVILMFLFSLSQGNPLLQAVLAGIAIGGLFSAATLGLAWFFLRAEADHAAHADAHRPRAEE